MAHPESTDPLSRLLAGPRAAVADGGMGTSLFELGLAPGETPETWNVTQPELVASVHSGFIDAGSDIILTNTFGGTRARLALDGHAERVEELNAAGVEVARSAAAGRDVVVAGSVGPTGRIFEPLGDLTHSEAVDIFAEQIAALAGADVIWIETLSSTEELEAAVEAAAASALPRVVTMSFDTHGKTMMGVAPATLAEWARGSGEDVLAVGANCGVGPADVVAAVAEISRTAPGRAIVAKANCGIPEMIEGTLWYPSSSDDMTAYARLALDAGAGIVGACCGSVPAHLSQIRAVVDSYQPSAFDAGRAREALGGSEPSPAPRQRRRRRREAAGPASAAQ